MVGSKRILTRSLFAGLIFSGALSLASQDELGDGPNPLFLSAGADTYEWVRGWAKLPAGMELGNTHGCIVVDSEDRVYLNTDTEKAVCVFDREGNFLKSWGTELAGGLHGMVLFEESGEERLFLAHIGRHEVLKTTLDGEVLLRVGVPEAAGLYDDPAEYRPTSVAVAPDGSFYVADGYGKSWIHRYNPEGTYLSSFGGPGTEPGQLRTPHGIWLETGPEEPRLWVADRENHRLQVFDSRGELLEVVGGDLRRPCHLHPFEDRIVVADLAGRVTLLTREGELVGHLGDNPDPEKRARNDVGTELWRDGEFLAPHCANWDSKGDLYVTDWLAQGRITKLRRVP